MRIRAGSGAEQTAAGDAVAAARIQQQGVSVEKSSSSFLMVVGLSTPMAP